MIQLHNWHETLAGKLAFFAILLQLLVALVFGAALLRSLWRGRRRELMEAGAWFVTAFALRWILPVHTMAHENRHGFAWGSRPPINQRVSPQGVISSNLVLHKIFALPLRPLHLPPDEALFLLHALLSAAAVAGMWALARQAFASRYGAWSAAALLLMQPLALLLAPTDEFLVGASGFCLLGMPLLWFGGRRDAWGPILAGAALVCLGASARELTLPLAALIPIVLLAATPKGQPVRWRKVLGVIALAGVTLLPRTEVIRAAAAAHVSEQSMVTLPHLPVDYSDGELVLDPKWVGWDAPSMPLWMGWLLVVAFLAMLGWCVVRRDWRTALIGLGTVLVAQTEGGLVGVNGWYPSDLRHQYFAMAMHMLTCGWLCGVVLEAVVRRFPRLVHAAYFPVPLLGMATLVAAPDGWRMNAPMVTEYAFLRAQVPSLPARARVVYPRMDEFELSSHLAPWLQEVQPNWEIMDARSWLTDRPRDSVPTYFFLDRVCLANRACFGGQELSEKCHNDDVRAQQPGVASPWGHLEARCAAVLNAGSWHAVAEATIVDKAPTAQHIYDIPVTDHSVKIAVLQLDAEPPTR